MNELIGERDLLLQDRNAQIRELERTVDKLKTTNGKLWYDIAQASKRPAKAPPERRENTELTITTKLATGTNAD
jgi:hypothetical protein